MLVKRWAVRAATSVTLLAVLALAACVPAARQPAPAVIRTTPPPWDAPRDAVSNIAAAGLVAEPLGSAGANRHVVALSIDVDGWSVAIPANVGIDRLRAQQAAVHTHDTTNQVWLEGQGTEAVTLGQFFTVWGVRFDGRCLGAACGELVVTADGKGVTDPTALALADVSKVAITARS